MNAPRVARAQPWAGISERFQRTRLRLTSCSLGVGESHCARGLRPALLDVARFEFLYDPAFNNFALDFLKVCLCYVTGHSNVKVEAECFVDLLPELTDCWHDGYAELNINLDGRLESDVSARRAPGHKCPF
jgi:hypothetical protein